MTNIYTFTDNFKINKMMEEMNEYWNNNFYYIKEESVLKLAENDLNINNVITGISDECYGASISQNKSYMLTYIYFNKEKDKVCGANLNLGQTLNEDSHKLLFQYSVTISAINNLNIIDIYNNYCHLLRSTLEKNGVTTFNTEEIGYMKSLDPRGELVAKTPIYIIRTIDKKQFYKDFFKNIIWNKEDKINSKIYLMFDLKTNLTKIGYSTFPLLREKTLQGEKPSIELLVCWIAPRTEEKELHTRYKEKRIRGEWFNLNFQDYADIKTYMQQYS